MQLTILLGFVASTFLLVHSKTSEDSNEVDKELNSNMVSLMAKAAKTAENHRVKRQIEFDIDDDILGLLQCQAAGVTPGTGLPLTLVTAAFVAADTDRNSILQGFEILPFAAAMRVYLRCASPFAFDDK